MDNPQAQEASPPASTTFQASTADPTVPVTPGSTGPRLPDLPVRPADTGPTAYGFSARNLRRGRRGRDHRLDRPYSLKNFRAGSLAHGGDDRLAVLAASYFSQGDPNTGRGAWTWLVWLGGAAVLCTG